MKLRDLCLLLLVNVSWGFNIVPTKLALMEVAPITAAFLRFLIVAVLCAPALRWLPGKMAGVFGAGLVLGALMFSLNNTAYAVAHNVLALAVAGQLGVPFSLILAIVFLKERIHWIRSVGILLSFLGVVLLSFDPHVFDERIALVLVTLGSLAYAVGTILMRRLSGVPALTIQAWLALVSLVPLFVLSLVLEPGGLTRALHADLLAFGCIFLSAVMASIVGHTGIAYLLQRYPIALISPLTLPAPLLAVFFSVVIFHNPLTTQIIVGGLMTLVGVGIITIRSAQKAS